MNEIVKALREMATYDCGYEEQSDTAVAAAALIQSQAAEIARLKDIAGRYEQLQEKHSALMTEADKLETQLAEAQRREKAAVECIADMEKSLPYGVGCYYCKHYTPTGGDGKCGDGCNFEWNHDWRGPQEAGKGEAE